MVGQNSQNLESKVLTAPPHRLHLLLIEGALRFGKQAADAFARGDDAAASAPLVRVIDVIGEMLVGVRGRESALNDRLAKLYWFLFQRVSEAKIHADPRRLAEALQLLEYERETWLLACEKAAATPTLDASPRTAEKRAAAEPGLSLEA
jgi:flagellar protein FliS